MYSTISFCLPTKTSTKQQQVRINDTSPQAMVLLKKKDPYLYYSIQAVKKAALINKDVDVSDLLNTGTHGIEVKRQSRISFESRRDNFLEEYFEINADGFNDSQDVSKEDLCPYLVHFEFETSLKSNSSDALGSVTFPTLSADLTNPQQVQVSTDLSKLKKSDPFAYFSIPAARKAAALNKDVDVESFFENLQVEDRKCRKEELYLVQVLC